jgi:hypothetical protein
MAPTLNVRKISTTDKKKLEMKNTEGVTPNQFSGFMAFIVQIRSWILVFVVREIQ